MTINSPATTRILTALAILPAWLACTATAADLGATLSTELNSAYVYHGITYNDGLVVQPSLDVTKGFFGVNVWANYDIDSYHGRLRSHNFSEVDLTPYLFTTLKGFELNLSLAEYNYPNTTTSDGNALPSNREIIGSVKRNIIGPFSAEVKIQYEIKEVKDYYARLSLIYTLPQCCTNLNIDLIASAAHVGDDTAKLSSGGQRGGFHEYNIKAVVSYAITGSTKICATIGNTDTIDDKTLPDPDINLYGGIGITQTL